MSFFYDLNARLAKLASKQDQKTIAESAKVEAVTKSPLTQALVESEKWIQKAVNPKTKGNLHKALHVPQGETIPKAKIAKATHSKNPKLRHMAQFAKNVAKEDTTEGEGFAPGQHPQQLHRKASEKTAADNAAAMTAAKATVPRYVKPGAPAVEGEMTPKQKSFAKLAPPTDKITFADKIAGAKQEVDEMLGDVAAEAMKKAVSKIADEGNAFTGKLNSTPKGGKFKLGNKEFKDTSSIEEEEMDEGYAEMDAWLKSREKEKGTGRFDKKKISTGTVYTRKPETFDDPETDPEATGGAPKRKGRPAGTKRAIGAKHSGRSKLARKDAIAEEDQEVCSECGQAIVYEKAPPGAKAERMVKHIKKSLSKDGKLSDKDKAIAYATTWKAKKAGKVEEESTDKEDQKAEKAGKKVAKDIEYDEKHKGKDDNRAEKAGKKVTKDIEYDDKKDKEEKVDETTTSGSVATATAAPKASKGMQFGKGVYEGFNSKLETMITESMNVTVNMSTDEQGQAQKSITVTATAEDADKLAELLKMAGVEQKQETCSVCGEANCGCGDEIVDENSPDWPTDEAVTGADDPQQRRWSGGLNGPKSTGQTTVPVVASQLRRTSTMEENVELERSLFKTWKNYKG